jgi:hypothetical protein
MELFSERKNLAFLFIHNKDTVVTLTTKATMVIPAGVIINNINICNQGTHAL